METDGFAVIRQFIDPVMIVPLRKKKLNSDVVYTRLPSTEAVLEQFAALSLEEVASRCENDDEKSADFVPSECVVHLVRNCRDERANPQFKRLYFSLMKRILQRLPAAKTPDGRGLLLKESRIQEEVVDSFLELLARDRSDYEDRLDFWEVAFGSALKKLKITVQDRVWREENRSQPLENSETGELSANVSAAMGSYDPFDSEELLKKDYRERLYCAIEQLDVGQRRIVKMLLEGFPIHSDDQNVVTISKTLNLSDKTVRTRKKEALAALRKILNEGGER